MWTRFAFVAARALTSFPFPVVFIEAEREEAIEIFRTTFDRNPNYATCNCCGADFSISEYPTLEEATAFSRGCKWVRGIGFSEEPGPPFAPLQFNKTYYALDEYLPLISQNAKIIRKE
jgi:hypothetical protein